ncbi:helix-turn-helix domain-containing protein [Nocardia takedensis]
MADRGSFDAGAFYAALNAVREARKLMWKDVAGKAKVSQSTLTRLAQGKRPDVDSLAALVDWAGLNADDFVVRIHSKPDTEPLAMFSTYLRADRNLKPEVAQALEEVVRATYKVLRED